MKCYIPTKGRPNTRSYIPFLEVGIEVNHFIEPQEYDLYDTPNKISILENDKGITYARNFMLQYAKDNGEDWVIFCDDDISSFYEYKNGKNIKRDAAIWKDILDIAKKLPFELYGINNKQLIWTAKTSYAINRYSVEACVLMNVQKIDWVYTENTKEDKDFALQTIKQGHGVVKFLKLGFQTPAVGSNKGGLHKNYQAKQDYEWAKTMAKKWHPFTKLYKTDKKVDVRVDFKAFAKSFNRIVK
jgi:hypothetical protein